ncbi:hypothetical protein BJX68DRAFT_227452 [Aspergillus pseudodeflectus]|uniref:Uncharacterized protein n=1 Tax=Aspergillus pseudodeflectus TaxID=176178 RepID=A0ABR4L2X8_9EURO
MSREQAARDSPGGSSRGEERGTRSQRRTASSSGFLVDSFLPRSKSFRSSNQQARLSESDPRGKRATSETEPEPKKRSRFHWGRQRESRESDPIEQDVIDDKRATQSPSFPQDTISESQGEPSHAPSDRASRESQAAPRLDRDSLQIVNLALNLSESRRRGQVGYTTPNRVSGTWTSSADGRASAAGSNLSRGSYAGHNARQSMGDDRVHSSKSPAVSLSTNSVLNSLPESAKAETVPQGISGGTFARAASARHHFELRYEYLRLLPSLPPLRSLESQATTDSSRDPRAQYPQHRAYNPLQAIRNRKVRFRERCPIDTEADGWNDVDKVHSWIDSIEAGYSRQARSPLECLILPPFQQGPHDASTNQGPDDVGPSTASPPSSVRQISRTGSLKARRPRSDWIIYPEELLADAAWVEETQNKSRIVDKDGNALYPNPSSLVVNDSQQEQVQGKNSLSTGRPSSHTSVSDARRSMSVEIIDPNRGRQRRKFKAPLYLARSSSPSDHESASKRHRFKIRSPSSSDSSDDEKSYRDPFRTNAKSRRRSVSPLRRKGNLWNEKRGSLSSVPSADDRYDPLFLAKMEGRGSNIAADPVYFPSIASNLSPPSSRASSPAKRGLPRAPGRAHSRSSHHRKGVDDDSSVDIEAEHMNSLPVTEPLSHETEPAPLPVRASTFHAETVQRPSNHERKDSAQHESKLRGIFKGPGKIAGKVGNEVSKMGDFILKKDVAVHSRKSSSALSDDSDWDDEETRSEKRAIPRAILRRLPTFSEDPSRSSPRNSDKSLTKNPQIPPSIVEPRQNGDDTEIRPGGLAGSHGRLMDLQSDASNSPKTHRSKLSAHSLIRGRRPLQFGPEIHNIRDEIRRGRIKDESVPYSMARPPVTGLAQAQPTPVSSSRDGRPPLSSQTRSWSISDRSVSISIESGVPGKQEVERTRALLLSSGIKAREIARRADSVRTPPPEFLQRAFGPDMTVPSVPQLYVHEIASRRLLKRIEASHSSFEGSMERVPKAAFAPLKTQLTMLEDLINKSLNTRVRAAAEEAEQLSMQLNTTSTLAVKQLSETLDHGIRKRGRRLRWLRRTGFVMLEWALIGLLWWVWLIVVAFKLLRKLLHGMVSGLRWILWL